MVNDFAYNGIMLKILLLIHGCNIFLAFQLKIAVTQYKQL